MKPGKELVGMPKPFLMEAPASWITRAAVTQGIPPTELARYFGMKVGGDTDLEFSASVASTVETKCGHERNAFRPIVNAIENVRIQKIDLAAHLLTHSGKPRYRYCPLCLAERGRTFMPLHWRFRCWRWCLRHALSLEDACPQCKAPVTLPADMQRSGIGRQGVGTLSRCLTCSASLASKPFDGDADVGGATLSKWEIERLKTGNAFVLSLLGASAKSKKVRALAVQFALRTEFGAVSRVQAGHQRNQQAAAPTSPAGRTSRPQVSLSGFPLELDKPVKRASPILVVNSEPDLHPVEVWRRKRR